MDFNRAVFGFGNSSWLFVLWFLCTLTVLTSVNSLGQDVLAEARQTSQSPNGSLSLLSVGVSRFLHAPSLDFTVNDANGVAAAFRQVAQLNEKQVELLTDEAGASSLVTTDRLMRTANAVFASAAAQSTIVFFFAGHGAQYENDFYLITHDFDPDNRAATGFALSQFREILAKSPAKTKVIILDCCFSGAFGKARSDEEKLAASFRVVPGCVAITASSESQASFENAELRAGVFTYWLTRGLRGAANKNADGRVDATELFRFVSDEVGNATGGKQTPAMSMDQFAQIPTVIDLVRPDRPSDTVGIIPFPLPPTPETMSMVLDTVGRFPEANPRRVIGVCHWVLKHSQPHSETADAARKLMTSVDQAILDGKLKLGAKEDDEQTRE